MFGRSTRILALVATITHVWVSLIAAPWHQIIAHTLAPARSVDQAQQTAELDSKPATHRCHCHHHQRCSDAATEQNAAPTQHSHSPVTPEHDDDCSMCQALTVGVIHLDPPAIDVVVEQKVFVVPLASVPPTSGVAIEPVSRGPPVV